MAWDKYFTYAGTEILNASRTMAYAEAMSLDWVKTTGTDADIAALVGDAPYSTPAGDSAPWHAANDPSTADFAGLIPLSVTGIEDSTRSSSPFEFVDDGGNPGRIRHEIKEVVFSVSLVAKSDCGNEAGFRWLKRALLAHDCVTGGYARCQGEDLSYFSCEPDGGTWQGDYGRYLRNVVIASGPRITGKRTVKGCPGSVWTVQWTARAGDPFEYCPAVDVFSGLGSAGGPDYLVGSSYEWTGAPHESTSLKYVDGELVATNLALNPSFEDAGSTVEVYRNYQKDPLFAGSGGGGYTSASWPQGSATLDTSVYSTMGQSLRVDTSGTGSNGTNPGTLITDPSASFVTARVRVRFDPTDEVGVTRTLFRIGGAAVASESFNTPVLGDGDWHEYSLTVPVIGTGSVTLYLYGSQLTGRSRWFDAASLQQGPVAIIFDGDTSPDSDLTPEWTGAANASESRLMGTSVEGVTVSQSLAVESTRWKKSGTRSLRLISATSSTSASALVAYPGQGVLDPGKTYTASVTVWHPTAPGASRRLAFVSSDPTVSSLADNVAGEQRISLTFTIPLSGAWTLRFYNGSSAGSPDSWWDDLIITEGTQAVDYFDGYTRGSFDPVTYEWTGAANNSTSTKTVKGQVVGTNLIVNPKLESNTTNYHLNGGTLSHPDGTYTRVTASNALGPAGVNLSMHTLRPPVTPGRSYVHSVDVRSDKKTGIYPIWYDSNGVAVGQATLVTAEGTGEWQRIVRSAVAPAGAATARLMMANGENFVIGDVMDWRHARFDVAGEDAGIYFDGDTPSSAAPSGADQFTAEICPAPIYTPIYDPDCPALVTPPPPPALKIGCMVEMEGLWDRDYALIPAEQIPLWDEARPTFRITNNDENDPVRNLRVGVYDSEFEADQDCAHRVGEYRISYIPAGGVLTIDAVLGSAYIADASGYARRADSLILGGPNEPPHWFGLSCGENYYVTLDHDADDSPDISLSLSLTGRTA